MQPLVPIANILHHDTILRLAGDGAFARGKAYFAEGRVADLQRKDGAVHATVRGSESYSVRIWTKEGSLAYSCNCPMGRDQAFCKHAVAVALSFVTTFTNLPGGAAGEEERRAPPIVADKTPPQPPVKPRAAATPLTAERARATPSRDNDVVNNPDVSAPRAKTLPGATLPKPEERADAAGPKQAAPSSSSVAEQLRAMPHDELVLFILETALDDDQFRERLIDRLRK